MVDVSVRRPIGVAMIVIAAVALGLFSLRNLAIDLFPKIDLPIAVVATSYTGAAPEEVENLVTRPLEGALGSLQGIDTISSQSQAGSSLVVMTFASGTNMDQAMLDIRERVDRIKGLLPEDAGDPSVLRFDPQQIPVLAISLSGLDSVRLQKIAEDQVVPMLERQNGVASVTVQGGQKREIQVEMDLGRMKQYGVSAGQIIQALAAENRSASAGSVARGDSDLQLRVTGEFESLADLENTLIPLPSGGRIKVGDVADIRDTFAKQNNLTLVNGEPALLLTIQKQSDANTVKVADNVTAILDDLQKQLPQGAKLNVVLDTAEPIRMSINSVVNNMVTGGALAVLVLILFLRNIRTTLVIGLSIPIAVIVTFTLMYFSGQTLNMISMGGLALGIGMMVDSSIVILENIFKYREQGMSMKEAAKVGASELGPAVIASTLTTVVVFLPIAFVQGLARDIFLPMALGVSFSLIASLVTALTLVPMLSSQILTKVASGPEQKKGFLAGFGDAFLRGYRAFLKWAIHHRKTVVAATLALLAGSFALVPMIGAEYFPSSDQGQFTISIETPDGTRLEETRKVAEQAGDLLKPYEDIIDNAYMTIGGDMFGSTGSNIASFTVTLIPSTERELSTEDVVRELDRQLRAVPGAEISVSNTEVGFGGGSPIQIAINGEDTETLNELASQVVWAISNIDGVFNPTASSSQGNAEMHITVNREMAAQYGLGYQQIVSDVQMAINGQVATRFRERGEEIDVRVILPEDKRNDMADVMNLQLATPTGQLVPLYAVAELNQVQGPVMIQRENQQRQVNVTSDVVGRDLGSVSRDVEAMLASMHFPDGYTYRIGGEVQDMMESFYDLGLALVFAVFLVYIVMAVQFESLLHPFIIMFAMPTTAIGVLVGLAATGTALSMPALIGFIILAGIVVNNSIILVDYVNILRRGGLNREEAILQGAPSRVRPIFMTTVTTVLGMLPLALGIGEGAELSAPLAIVVIFGLSFSTMFTLIFVPVMYIISENTADRFKRLFRFGPKGAKSDGMTGQA
jgi:HAE1 family hydrophobic/amphiphilic exporter-1